MDKFQAAFELLYFLSAVDGDVVKEEIAVIEEFLDQNYEKVEFDPLEVIKSLEMLNWQGVQDELDLTADFFKEFSDANDRFRFLEFGFHLIASDDKITDEERTLFISICNAWDIDYDKFIEKFIEN